MSDGIRLPGTEDPRTARGTRPKRGLTAGQWTILILMAGVLLAIGGALLWVLRAGLIGAPEDVLVGIEDGPTPTPTPGGLLRDAVPTPSDLYWPPFPQPLATPNAPSDLLWWDARYGYRRQIEFDVVSAQLPAGMWARVIFDGESSQREGKMRTDGADLRVLAWDGTHWWELPRAAQPRREKRGWDVLFHLQDTRIAQEGRYYLYYGHPLSAAPPDAPGAPTSSRLLLALGDEEGVEWGPEIVWTANSPVPQRVVSPDGRITIECPPGGPERDVRVRLRIVPVGERNGYGPLPDFELHVDPPPSPLGSSKIVHWDPALILTINWAGLPTMAEEVASWAYFVYNEDTATWYGVSVEYDRERGLTRVVTDQM